MKIRNTDDNRRYVNHLQTAIDQIEQAIDSITYASYPDLNRKVIAKLIESVELIETCAAAGLFKP